MLPLWKRLMLPKMTTLVEPTADENLLPTVAETVKFPGDGKVKFQLQRDAKTSSITIQRTHSIVPAPTVHSKWTLCPVEYSPMILLIFGSKPVDFANSTEEAFANHSVCQCLLRNWKREVENPLGRWCIMEWCMYTVQKYPHFFNLLFRCQTGKCFHYYWKEVSCLWMNGTTTKIWKGAISHKEISFIRPRDNTYICDDIRHKGLTTTISSTNGLFSPALSKHMLKVGHLL